MLETFAEETQADIEPEAFVEEEVARRDARPPFVLALDIGTSSVRAAFYEGLAREVAGTQVRLERGFSTTPDGGAEVDAERSVAEVVRVIDSALALSPELASGTEAVAVSCFWHSLVGVGPKGEAITPVLGWADTRPALEVGELRRRFDERATHARTGCRFHASYWPAKLLWLWKECSDRARPAVRWMSFGEYLTQRLCGEAWASVSMASGTGLLDQRRCAWDEELLRGLGLSPDQLPPLADAGATLAITGEYARTWPQLRGRPWFPAVGDGAANNIGAGCISPATLALMIGTSGAMRVLWRGDVPSEIPPGLWCYRADRSRVVVGGALSDGGGLYEWMNEALALGADVEATETALALMEPDAHGLTVLPFWAGERSTGWNTRARGAILGLTMHTRPVDILRAALEAVAYRIALIAEALEPFAPGAEIRASGGAIWASSVWAQILADVLGRPLYITRAREASSRGVVGLALEALGRIKSIEEMPVLSGYTCEPHMARHARYRAALKRHEAAYEFLVHDQANARLLDEVGRRQGAHAEITNDRGSEGI